MASGEEARGGLVDACRSVVPYLLVALRDSDAGVRRAAVTCLSAIRDLQYAVSLLFTLHDSDALLRRTAVTCLSALRDSHSAMSLLVISLFTM